MYERPNIWTPSDRPTWWASKGPLETLTWAETITPYVNATENIAQIEATITPSGTGELSISAVSVTGQTIDLTLNNGQPGRVYTINFVVTMSDGSRYQPTAQIGCRNTTPAGWPPPPPQNPGPGTPAIWPPYYTGLTLDGVAVTVISTTGWPTSPAGLGAGAVWVNGTAGWINAVLPVTPTPAQPLFAGLLRSTDLLSLGAACLPQYDPQITGQLWLNGVAVVASLGSFTGLAANGSVATVTNTADWPTSPEGLPAGAVWVNGSSGWINVVAGFTSASLAPTFAGFLTSVELLAYGASILPTTDPVVAGQYWVNGSVVSISTGAA
jgi:hypothetical protein